MSDRTTHGLNECVSLIHSVVSIYNIYHIPSQKIYKLSYPTIIPLLKLCAKIC